MHPLQSKDSNNNIELSTIREKKNVILKKNDHTDSLQEKSSITYKSIFYLHFTEVTIARTSCEMISGIHVLCIAQKRILWFSVDRLYYL